MQEEKEISEAFELMAEHILKLDRMIRVLYERQNRIDNQELQEDVPTDSSKQIHIPGL